MQSTVNLTSLPLDFINASEEDWIILTAVWDLTRKRHVSKNHSFIIFFRIKQSHRMSAFLAENWKKAVNITAAHWQLEKKKTSQIQSLPLLFTVNDLGVERITGSSHVYSLKRILLVKFWECLLKWAIAHHVSWNKVCHTLCLDAAIWWYMQFQPLFPT